MTLNLSGVFAGTSATLVIRLVNNDQDHSTSVAITCVQCMNAAGSVIPWDAPTSSPAVAAASSPLPSAPASRLRHFTAVRVERLPWRASGNKRCCVIHIDRDRDPSESHKPIMATSP